MLLLLLHTKKKLIAGATLYLHIYFLGMPAMAMYNFGCAVLSAAGDTRRPLIYLLIAGVLNVGLNLFFVIVCHLGVLGVALASVISLYFSAALVLFRLFTCKEEYGLCADELHLDREAARTVLALGIPAALQNAIFAVANLFVQSAVNSFDTVIVEGNAAAANADGLIYDMMAAFYAACTTFMAQNYGAGQMDRVKKGYRISFWTVGIWGSLIMLAFLLFPNPIACVFFHETKAIETAVSYLVIIGFSEAFMCVEIMTIGALSGLGKTKLCSIISIAITATRIPLAVVLGRSALGLNGIWWALTLTSVAKGIIFYLVFQKCTGKGYGRV